MIAVPCAKFRKDSSTEQEAERTRALVKYKFKTDFARLTCIIANPEYEDTGRISIVGHSFDKRGQKWNASETNCSIRDKRISYSYYYM